MARENATKRKTETVKQSVRRYGRVNVNEQNITKLDVAEVARLWKVTQDSVRTALRELVAETGSGWHGTGNSYEFRMDERRAHRAPNDTHVTERTLEYMRGTTPGSHQPVRIIAAAIKARNSSVSQSLGNLVEDKWLFLVKVRKGVYSYRPPNYAAEMPPPPTALDELADEGDREQAHQEQAHQDLDRLNNRQEQTDHERAEFLRNTQGGLVVPETRAWPDDYELARREKLPPFATPAAPTKEQLDDMVRARQGQIAQEQAQWNGAGRRDLTYTGDDMPYRDGDPEHIPDGFYKELTVTTNGTRLAENAKGELFELLPLRRPT